VSQVEQQQIRKTLITLLAEASVATGVDATDIIGPSKRALYIKARIFFARAAHAEGYKLVDIGEALGRSHSAAVTYLKPTDQRKEQTAMKMSKEELRKAVDKMDETERRELVRTLGETSNKAERDLLGEIFSRLESEPLPVAPVETVPVGGPVAPEVPAAPKAKKRFWETI
jgi:hypothetical protein